MAEADSAEVAVVAVIAGAVVEEVGWDLSLGAALETNKTRRLR